MLSKLQNSPGPNFILGLSPAAWYRKGIGQTVTGSGVSQWDDQSGNARHLLQATDAARPTQLPFTGTRYLYLPGVASNNATSPDSVPASVLGDIDIRIRLACDDYTPAVAVIPISKMNAAGSYCYQVSISVAGAINIIVSTNGTLTITNTSSASIAATNGTITWIRATRVAADGKANFYTSTTDTNDPNAVTWTLLGVEQAGAASAIFDGNSQLCVGSAANGTGNPFAGKIYRASVYSTIGGTTPVVDFNASDGNDGSTSFVSSSTGETWTVNSSGGLPAQIVGTSSILFNGTSHFLKTAPFTLNQPEAVFLLFKQVSWTQSHYFFDGSTANSMALIQTNNGAGASPSIQQYAGAYGSEDNTSATIGAYHVLATVFNGASSVLQVDNNASNSQNPGAANAGSFTLGANPVPGAYSNIQVMEAIIFPTAHDAGQRARVIQYLAGIGGVSL